MIGGICVESCTMLGNTFTFLANQLENTWMGKTLLQAGFQFQWPQVGQVILPGFYLDWSLQSVV